ncbi:hypothetical protein [Marisediminicola sp. LYQ134]|uniref:hypothetical protein n=1 Tax=Marisediminicola sp. LYQ134 TaxID=3391061 RepID=UPI0039835B1F
MQHTPIAALIEQATKEGLREGGKQTLKRARELSPSDSGDSDRSGFSLVDDLTMQVGFRSLVSRLQHENLEYQHPNGGQPKFLETAAAEIDVTAIIAAKVRSALG